MNQYDIQTSNYARNGQHSNAIAISCSTPEWYKGAWMPILAPTWPLISALRSGDITEDFYAERYIKLLQAKRLTPTDIIDMIPPGSILLCYEKPGEFCHRRVLADWIENETGIQIPEWKNETERRKEVQEKIVESLIIF